jgi:hypothetical protein
MRNPLSFVKNVESLPRTDPERDFVAAAAGSARPSEVPLVVARARVGRLIIGLQGELDVVAGIADRAPPPPKASPVPVLQELVFRGRALLRKAHNDARKGSIERTLGKVNKLNSELA